MPSLVADTLVVAGARVIATRIYRVTIILAFFTDVNHELTSLSFV
jgi:hypothetical protein